VPLLIRDRFPTWFLAGLLLPAALYAAEEPMVPVNPERAEQSLDKVPDAAVQDTEKSPYTGKRYMPEWNEYEGPLVATKVGALIIGDYNTFNQDTTSEIQVGHVPSEFEFRAARLVVRGKMGKARHVSYFYAGEYNGMSREPDQSALRMTDLAFTVALGDNGALTLGKTKEPIHLARIMPGDGVLMMERATIDALVPSRGTGIKWHNTAQNRRLNWTIGWFSDLFESGNSTQDLHNQFTGRISGTPIWADNGRRLLHLGASFRHAEVVGDVLRFRERPEANTAPRYLDTGEFQAENSRTVNLELGAIYESLSLQAEYLQMQVDSAATGDPKLSGWYVAGSYILTGESRSYSRNGGFFFKVAPARPMGGGSPGYGAVELTARYSDTDFNDEELEGGEFSRWSLGANWYLTDQWRLEVNGGQGDLDRFDATGRTDFLQFRLQWQF
jgi:phosphate-selective porin OprO/OprP